MSITRARLDGIDAEPGRVAAADVARIIIGLERTASVEVRTVLSNTQLQLDLEAEKLWQVVSFAELQAAQSTSGIVDTADFAITDLTDGERAAFAAALAE